MYPDHFGMKEAGFSITPDPEYLYLSPRHKEALAHLLYGTGEGGGFVLLTGEVGTGKTTVCRAFLEQLPEHVDIALILNPALSAPELLASICEEFGIHDGAGENSGKRLVDRLNTYLLEAHARGRRPVLMIDEAQNLAPEVLEQIRLLSNLETPKHKLLQIFLVGQPELRELLGEQRLRQLAQRITARFHLTPLDAHETLEYIGHRLAVAGAERTLFEPAAMRRIFQLTGGVPRLINILCDRALLGAYATRANRVNRAIVERAAAELRGASASDPRAAWRRRAGLAAVLLAGVLAIGWLTRYGVPGVPAGSARPSMAVQPSVAPGGAEQKMPNDSPIAAAAAETTPAQRGPATPPAGESADIASTGFVLPQARAVRMLLRHWSMQPPEPLPGDGCEAARQAGLRCRDASGSWNKLRWFNRPALLALRQASGETGYAVLVGLDTEHATLLGPEGPLRLPLSRLDTLWFGDFRFFWKAPAGDSSIIGTHAPARAIRWLRQALSHNAGIDLSDMDSARFDAGLKAAVTAFQRSRGLQADGIAGPETLIQLTRIAGLPDTPRLIPDH